MRVSLNVVTTVANTIIIAGDASGGVPKAAARTAVTSALRSGCTMKSTRLTAFGLLFLVSKPCSYTFWCAFGQRRYGLGCSIYKRASLNRTLRSMTFAYSSTLFLVMPYYSY